MSTNNKGIKFSNLATFKQEVDKVYIAADKVQNFTDEQKILVLNNILGKEYLPSYFSSLGKKILAKNIQTVDGVQKNVLTQDFFKNDNDEPLTNTVYVIKYDYDLCGNDITIPSGCMLEFDGGKLSNGRIISNSTYVKNYSINCISNLLVKNGFIPIEYNANNSLPRIYTLECYGDFINDGVRVFCMAMNGTQSRTLYIDRDVRIDQSSVVTIDGGDFVDSGHTLNLCCQNITVTSRTNATITFTNNTNFYYCKYFRVKDIKILFDSKTNTAATFTVWNSNNVTIENCEMSSTYVTEENKLAGGGIHILKSYNIDIKNNYIHNVQMDAILVHDTCTYINITNNRIDDSKNIGIEVEGRTGGVGTTELASCSNVVISGNQVYNCTSDTSIHINFSNHIVVSNNIINYSDIGINCISCQYVDITNNVISVSHSGLLIWQEIYGDISLKPKNINVIGNTIRSSMGHNLSGRTWALTSLLHILNAEDIIVLGNNIIFTGSQTYLRDNDAIVGIFSSVGVKISFNDIIGNNGNTLYNTGILFGRSYLCKQTDPNNSSGTEGDCYDIKIVSNTLKYLSRAIATIKADEVTWVDHWNTVAHRLLIDGNSVDSCSSDAILDSSCSYVTICNNIVTNTNALKLLSKGSTSNRLNMTPYLSAANIGLEFYDQTLAKPVYWTNNKTGGKSGWVDANGEDASKVIPKRVAFFGNSLANGFYSPSTSHTSPDDQDKRMGMAASKNTKDYYHRVCQYLKLKNPNIITNKYTANPSEGSTSEATLRERIYNNFFQYLTGVTTDIVVIQFGDNVSADNTYMIQSGFKYILNTLRSDYVGQDCKIYWVGLWFNNDDVYNAIEDACKEYNATMIDIRLCNASGNRAAFGNTYRLPNSDTFTKNNVTSATKSGDILTVTFEVNGQSYTSEIKVSSYNLNTSTHVLTFTGYESYIDDAGESWHPNDKGFKQIADTIIDELNCDL